MSNRSTHSRSTASTAVSIILPAKNEERALRELLPAIRRVQPEAEVIVVDDGSTDGTAQTASRLGATVVAHPFSLGNGAAVKSGVRAARGDLLVLLDADSQHDPADIPRLIGELEDRGCDMVVGCRSASCHASIGRRFANAVYNAFASYVTGREVKDLTSGFRAVRAARFLEFLHLLPNGFSYPTTSTMAFFRSGYPVSYVPISAGKRIGKSHIKPLQDGLRFLLIIFKVGTLYSPLKLFFPFAAAFFFAGLANYVHTYLTAGRFTNMSALMFTTAVLVFLIGLVSEQITQLVFRPVVADLQRPEPASGSIRRFAEDRAKDTGT